MASFCLVDTLSNAPLLEPTQSGCLGCTLIVRRKTSCSTRAYKRQACGPRSGTTPLAFWQLSAQDGSSQSNLVLRSSRRRLSFLCSMRLNSCPQSLETTAVPWSLPPPPHRQSASTATQAGFTAHASSQSTLSRSCGLLTTSSIRRVLSLQQKVLQHPLLCHARGRLLFQRRQLPTKAKLLREQRLPPHRHPVLQKRQLLRCREHLRAPI